MQRFVAMRADWPIDVVKLIALACIFLDHFYCLVDKRSTNSCVVLAINDGWPIRGPFGYRNDWSVGTRWNLIFRDQFWSCTAQVQ